MPDKTVICDQLNKSFGETAVVQDVSFSLEAGKFLALLGPSGCGKTSTLRLLAGFEVLDSGRIEIDGVMVADGRFHLPPEKRRVGMVFQDYAIFPHLNVAENIACGLEHIRKSAPRVQQMLDMVGLPDLGDKMPHALSGGQQQRVALARALAPDPAILLLDEPFSNLDTSLRAQVRGEVRALLKQNGATAVFVTHDQQEAMFLGDQVAVMNAGKLEQVGTPEAVFHRPQTRFVAEFMGQTNFISGEVTALGIATPLGRLPQMTSLPLGAKVEVAVRPDDVRLDADDEGNGRITNRQFTGIAYIYEVGLENGDCIHSWQPHTFKLALGTPVQAAIRQSHTPACFHNGKAV